MYACALGSCSSLPLAFALVLRAAVLYAIAGGVALLCDIRCFGYGGLSVLVLGGPVEVRGTSLPASLGVFCGVVFRVAVLRVSVLCAFGCCAVLVVAGALCGCGSVAVGERMIPEGVALYECSVYQW